LQAVLDEGNGESGHVNADPVAAEFLGGVNGRAAAAERVEDYYGLLLVASLARETQLGKDGSRQRVPVFGPTGRRDAGAARKFRGGFWRWDEFETIGHSIQMGGGVRNAGRAKTAGHDFTPPQARKKTGIF
jgi:hypothetical protein